MISCPLNVADEWTDISTLEAKVHAWGREVMAEALQVAWQQYQTRAPACSRCESGHTFAEKHRAYPLPTVFGPVELARQRRRCSKL